MQHAFVARVGDRTVHAWFHNSYRSLPAFISLRNRTNRRDRIRSPRALLGEIPLFVADFADWSCRNFINFLRPRGPTDVIWPLDHSKLAGSPDHALTHSAIRYGCLLPSDHRNLSGRNRDDSKWWIIRSCERYISSHVRTNRDHLVSTAKAVKVNTSPLNFPVRLFCNLLWSPRVVPDSSQNICRPFIGYTAKLHLRSKRSKGAYNDAMGFFVPGVLLS